MKSNEKELYTILQGDDKLREAIRHREQQQPPMPADLNDRLMRRLEDFHPLPSRKRRTKKLRWMIPAACLLVIISIGVTFMPSKETHDEMISHKSAVVQTCFRCLAQEEPKTDTLQQNADITEAPKAVAVVRNKPKKKPRRETTQKKDSHSSTEVAIAESPCPQPEVKPAVLTECDIPITRPENYRYTPEEIELLKKQADDAYMKWVRLELEITKHNLEQTIQQ